MDEVTETWDSSDKGGNIDYDESYDPISSLDNRTMMRQSAFHLSKQPLATQHRTSSSVLLKMNLA